MRRLLALAVLTPALALVPGTARAQSPDAVGWWSSAHRSAVPVVVPAAPDVASGDLLLQGGDVQRELPNTPPAPTAYAALRYAVPEGGTVERLTLAVASDAQAMDVRAYATTSAWQPAENGAIEAAPVPDLSRYAVGTLTGTTLVFDDIGKLVTDDGLLNVVLLPGVSDRVVVLPPKATALTVSEPEQPVVAPPPPPLGEPEPSTVGPVLAPVPAAVLPPAPVAAIDVPQVAPTQAAPQPQVQTQPVAASSRRTVTRADDSRTRLIVLLEALLLAVFFGLLGTGPLAALARVTGLREEATAERGIGRFRGPREGTVARL